MFLDEYKKLYLEKHGNERTEEEQLEIQIDDVVSHLFSLVSAYKRKVFPQWAEYSKGEILSGTLLAKAKQLLN